MRWLPLLLILPVVSACQPREEGDTADVAQQEIRMCDLVPVPAVATAVGADPGQLRAAEEGGACRYAWEDGAAQIGPMVVAPSIEEAEAFFEQNFGGIARTVAQQDPRGELKPIEGVGDRAYYEGGVVFEDDEVLGRIASVQSMMWVLYRNVVIQVGANLWQPHDALVLRDGPSQDELDANREATITLARQLVTYLARHEG